MCPNLAVSVLWWDWRSAIATIKSQMGLFCACQAIDVLFMLPLSLVTARRYEVLKLIQHDKQGLVRRQPLIGVCGDTSMSEVSRKKSLLGVPVVRHN